jgi:O-antigen/teichoic acid export membrane protein
MARVAVSGTGWATGQAILSKLVTLMATWVIARNLSSEEIALATLAMTVTKFLCVLPPLNMGDLLIAHRRSLAWLRPIAVRIGFRWGWGITIGSIALAPLIARYYSNFPTVLLTALLMTAAFRPLSESMQVVPLTALRLSFRNRAIAIVDGTVQLVAAIATITLAVLGAGPWAMVAPLIGSFALKALGYRLAQGDAAEPRDHGASHAGSHAHAASALVQRRFITTGGAQYVHSLIDTLPLLILGKLATESETGLFGFSVTLAAQANTVIAGQIAGVLQPVLGHLGQDPARQTSGYLRAMRMLSAVAVPICLCQAAFSETLFSIFIQGDLRAAAPVFAALSLAEAFYFASAPTMAMLRAQGRFGTFLAWQVAHLTAVILALPVAAHWGGALPVAITIAGLWSISLPTAVWITTRPVGGSLWHAIRLFLAPWITGLPIAALAWFGARALAPLGMGAQLATLAIGAPLTGLLMLLSTRLVQPDAYHEMRSIAERMLERVRRRMSRA